MNPQYIELRYPKIDFAMPIMDSIMEMEKLRYKVLQGYTIPSVFYQIKHIFQMLESIGSSRIEGNNTTVMDYVESTRIEQSSERSLFEDKESLLEIQNIEKAMSYIEDNINSITINHMFIRELHALTVEGLSSNREGSPTPGQYRTCNVRIHKSQHTPPEYIKVPELMDELLAFVNEPVSPKYDLLKIALAHHRFVWIHPFSNGNGRVVRLFTYALLLKFVFTSNNRIINPVAVFCSNRDRYYDKLARADTGTDEGYIEWTEYMLNGLKSEIEKIDKIGDYDYLSKNVLKPMIQDALSHQYITNDEYKILETVIFNKNQIIQAADIKPLFPKKTASDISRQIRLLVQKKMLMPVKENARKYHLAFNNNYLLRSILEVLDKEGFLPQSTSVIK